MVAVRSSDAAAAPPLAKASRLILASSSITSARDSASSLRLTAETAFMILVTGGSISARGSGRSGGTPPPDKRNGTFISSQERPELVGSCRSAPNNPHKLPSRRSVGSAAEPPWAARTARRHASRNSLAPRHSSVAAATVPQFGRHVGAACSLE